jgi:hypothetical protein
MSRKSSDSGVAVAAVQVELVRNDLVEEPPVAAAGERVGHDQLTELGLRRLELRVGAAQLAGHVLEGHELHPSAVTR